MPFDYTPRLPKYMPLSQATIEGASRSPFEIAGKAMSQLDEAIDSRAFRSDLSGAEKLEDLLGLKPRTKEDMALQQQKLGVFNALDAQKKQDELFALKGATLAENIRHNMAIEGYPKFASKGFGVDTDPITGQSRIFNKDTGKFTDTKGGTSYGTTDSGEPITSKTAYKALTDGTTVYTDRSGNPLTSNGEVIVKSRTPFNLKKPAEASQEQQTVNTMERMLANVRKNPDSVGSMGSGFWNYISNNFNDVWGKPTKDNLTRTKIRADSNIITTMMRNMQETGVMTDKDFDRNAPSVPQPNDSYEVYIEKMKVLKPSLIGFFKKKALMQGTEAPKVSMSETILSAGGTGNADGTFSMPDGRTYDSSGKRIR